MSNTKRGYVNFDIGGKDRPMRLDLNAIASLEKEHGRPIHELFVDDRMSVALIRDALFFGLKSGDPRQTRALTADLVGEWLTVAAAEEGLGEVLTRAGKAIMEALEVAMPGVVVRPTEPAPASSPTPASPTPAAPPKVEPPADSTTTSS